MEIISNYQIISLVAVVLLGLGFGSFATMASYRLPRGEEIVWKASHCTACQHPLGVRDLFPLFSWLFARGACRHCGAKISSRYPLIELATLLLFLLVFARYGWTVQTPLLWALAVGVVVLSVTDFEHGIIPDMVQVFLLAVGILFRIVNSSGVWEIVGGVVLGLGIGVALRWGYGFLRRREGLGLGDVKFLAVAGIWLKAQAFAPFFFFAGVLGTLTALVWRKWKNEREFPFGPALALSVFVLVVFPEAEAWFWRMVKETIVMNIEKIL